MLKKDKSAYVEKLTTILETSNSVVLVDFTGLTVKNQQELKKRLKEINSSLIIVKNTLLKRAGMAAKLNEQMLTDSVLAGPTALVITKEDPIAPLTILDKFKTEHEVPQFKVAVIEGSFANKEELIKLAKLPGKNVLLAQVLGALMSPSYELVGTLNANLQKLVYILNERKIMIGGEK